MIHFLGDFYIDEIPNVKLSKNQIILLAYLSIKKTVYLTEALDILTVDDRYEVSYIKKLLKVLSEKISPYIELEHIRNSKVVAHINLQTDIQLLIDEIENFNGSSLKSDNVFVRFKNESEYTDLPLQKVIEDGEKKQNTAILKFGNSIAIVETYLLEFSNLQQIDREKVNLSRHKNTFFQS